MPRPEKADLIEQMLSEQRLRDAPPLGHVPACKAYLYPGIAECTCAPASAPQGDTLTALVVELKTRGGLMANYSDAHAFRGRLAKAIPHLTAATVERVCDFVADELSSALPVAPQGDTHDTTTETNDAR